MTYLPVTVYIDDINDHKPVFTSAPYNITVLESATPGEYMHMNMSSFVPD